MDNIKKSEMILDELKKRGQREVVDVEEEKAKLVVFTVFDEFFAFYGSEVKEILPPQTIYYVPGAPDYIIGVINNRGDVESVININKFLGFPDPEITQKSRIALASGAGVQSGILVDSLLDVADVPVSSIGPPISTLEKGKREFVAGETAYKGKNITVLSVERIFEKMK